MSLLVGSFTMGLILSLLALGVLVSFRILAFRDLTVDGSIALGGAVAATLLVAGWNPWLATAAACLAGALAGTVTGVLATRFQINGLLAGILVMTALYSVNLRVMGKSNLPLMKEQTIITMAQRFAASDARWSFSRWEVPVQDVAIVAMISLLIGLVAVTMYAFFRTNLGLAMRASGDNEQMIRALGVEVGWMTTFGLALSNGLVALAGALLVQYQGFADVQMGIGMVVWGFASVIIGESLVGSRQIGLLLVGAVMGSILFRLLVAIALRWGLNPNDLRERIRAMGLGLEDRLDNAIGSLSGGQRQSLTLLMAGLLKPDLLLLDEHTAALDPKSADQVIRLTEEFIRRDRLTTLMVTHSMHQAAHLGDRLIMMVRGRVHHDFQGAEKRRLTPEDLLARFEEVRRADQLDETAAEMLGRQYV